MNLGANLVNTGPLSRVPRQPLAAVVSKFQKRLEGGAVDGWYALNNTADVADGIGGWSDAEIVQYLKTGAAPDKGVAVGPMAETLQLTVKGQREHCLHVAVED